MQMLRGYCSIVLCFTALALVITSASVAPKAFAQEKPILVQNESASPTMTEKAPECNPVKLAQKWGGPWKNSMASSVSYLTVKTVDPQTGDVAGTYYSKSDPQQSQSRSGTSYQNRDWPLVGGRLRNCILTFQAGPVSYTFTMVGEDLLKGTSAGGTRSSEITLKPSK